MRMPAPLAQSGRLPMIAPPRKIRTPSAQGPTSSRQEKALVAPVRVHKVGGPEVLTYEDIPVPAAGAGQLRVRQHAIGVNFVDTYFRSGLYPAPNGLPFVAGNEAAGEVVEVGSGVNDFKPGDRAAYVQGPGCYTAERLVPADRVV